jgi:predicted DNA-binding protein
MRTTIEISDEHRARLLELAARRGEKGFSLLVREALEKYLEDVDAQEDRVRDALAVLGSLDEDAAKHMEAVAKDLRDRWR